RRRATRQKIFLTWVLGRSNALFRHFNLLEALEGKQQFDQIGGWIFAGSPDDGGECVGDRSMERDPLDHQACQVEADTLAGCESHLSSEFGAWSRKTQAVTPNDLVDACLHRGRHRSTGMGHWGCEPGGTPFSRSNKSTGPMSRN